MVIQRRSAICSTLILHLLMVRFLLTPATALEKHVDDAYPSLAEDMFRILSDPAIEHKFVKGLSDEARVEIYRKSGTWRQYHADSGIIAHDAFKYIAVALMKDPRGGSLMTQLIDVIDDVVSRLHR